MATFPESVKSGLTTAQETFLDDIIADGGYEEGTWTPVVTADTPGDLSVAYTNQIGEYVRNGKLVSVFIRIDLSTFTHTTAAGGLLITGLPYTVQADLGVACANAPGLGGPIPYPVGYTTLTLDANGGTTTVKFRANGDDAALTNISITDIPSAQTWGLHMAINYKVA